MKKVFLLLTLLCTACSKIPTTQQQQEDVQKLTKTFTILEQLRVQSYRHQDWCKNLAYSHGKFSNNNMDITCNLFEGEAIALDAQAEQDFAAIDQTLKSTHVPLIYISNVQYDAAEKISRAEFQRETCACTYVYQPNYKTLPESIPNQLEYRAINSDWYFILQDWN